MAGVEASAAGVERVGTAVPAGTAAIDSAQPPGHVSASAARESPLTVTLGGIEPHAGRGRCAWRAAASASRSPRRRARRMRARAAVVEEALARGDAGLRPHHRRRRAEARAVEPDDEVTASTGACSTHHHVGQGPHGAARRRAGADAAPGRTASPPATPACAPSSPSGWSTLLNDDAQPDVRTLGLARPVRPGAKRRPGGGVFRRLRSRARRGPRRRSTTTPSPPAGRPRRWPTRAGCVDAAEAGRRARLEAFRRQPDDAPPGRRRRRPYPGLAAVAHPPARPA